MRRLLLGGSIVLVLTSCIGGEKLPPEEVLKNAARAGQELESSRFTALGNIDFHHGDVLKATVNGTLHNAGRQSQFTTNLTGKLTQGDVSYGISSSFDVFVALEHELYGKVQAFDIDPPHPLLRTEAMQNLLGRWWKLQEQDMMSTAESVTPDPSLLRAQAEIVHVTKSHGLEKLNGRTVYHYDVSIDKDKLATFLAKLSRDSGESLDAKSAVRSISDYHPTGELWIDAETFVVHRLLWNISREEPNPFMSSFRIDFSDHNRAPQISPPADFELFSPMLLLQGGSILPPAFDSDFLDAASRDVSTEDMPEYDEVWLDDPLSVPDSSSTDLPSL